MYPSIARSVRLALQGALLAAVVTPVSAQEAVLEEITVTAQKREQRLQDVPASVTAFTVEQIDRLHINEAREAIAQIPNTSVLNVLGPTQAPSIGIRGVSLNNFNDSFESPVAMYMDENYRGTLIGQTAQLFDIERIEVLKGPQGTLYGRNTTGGLIHVITRAPTPEFDLRFDAEYGDHDLKRFSGGIGGPLSSRVRGRVAFEAREAEGWSRGFVDGVNYSDEDIVSTRARLDVDLTDAATLQLTGHYSKADLLGTGFGLRGYLDPDSGERCDMARIEAGVCVSPSLGDASANDYGGLKPGRSLGSNLPADRGSPPRQSLKLSGGMARLDWKLNSWTLTGLVAYDDTEKFYEEDLDGPGFLFDDGLSLKAHELKAELRAAGSTGAHEWLIGAFFFDDHKDTGSFLIPADIFTTRGVVKTDSWAIFGQDEIRLGDRTRLTLGARYTEEDKSLDFSRTGFIEDEGTRSFSASNLTGKVALSFLPTDNLTLYGSVSTGFKTGGFNTQFVFGTLEEIDPVDNEELVAYEVGAKTSFLEGRAKLNAAAFYYDFSDIQLNVFTTVPGAPFPSNFLRNAGDSKIRGAELELQLVPFEHTFVSLGAGIVRARIESDQIVSSAGVTTPIDGKKLPNAPGATFNAALSQSIPLGSSGELYGQANYSWRDRYYFSIENVNTESQAAYGLLDLSFGWRSADSRWDAQAYLENATDEQYSIFNTDLDSTFGVVTWGKPRWWGLRLAYRY